MGSKTRYKFFEKVWNDDINHAQKGTAAVSLSETFTFDDDVLYTIPLKERYRPDVIARKFYGDPKLFWVIVYANNMNDSPEGFEVNRTVRVPRIERIMELV